MIIEKLELLTADIAGTMDFYHSLLGMRLLFADEHKVSFDAGKTRLSFVKTTQQRPVYHFAFTIPSNKLDEAYHFISRRVDVMDVPPSGKIADFSNWNAAAFYFYDNNGNIVECIVRYDMANESHENFTGSSIYAVSEIGLVTEDVPALLKEIGEKYDIPVFEKQPPQQRFAVMGNNEGLFIVVEKERPWFPTQVKAHQFQVRAEIQNGDGKKMNLDFPFD